MISAEPRKTACFVVLRWRRLKPRLLKGKGPAEASGTKGKGEKKRTGDRGMFNIAWRFCALAQAGMSVLLG